MLLLLLDKSEKLVKLCPMNLLHYLKHQTFRRWLPRHPNGIKGSPRSPRSPRLTGLAAIAAKRPPKYPNATWLLQQFGNGHKLARALKKVGTKRNPATIYKWTYAFPKGTGNVVPSEVWPAIFKAADASGIQLKKLMKASGY